MTSFDRLRAPVQTLLAWAVDAPDRMLLSSNESGKTQVYAWDRKTDTRCALPAEAKAAYTFLAPAGDAVVYVQDVNDSEIGHLRRIAWDGNGLNASAPEPVWPESLPPQLYVYGLQIGRDGTLYFAGSASGIFRIYRIEPDGNEARVLYEHTHEAYLPYLSADENLLAFCTSEPANSRHWQATVVEAGTGRRIAQLSDGDAFSVTPARWLMGAADVRPWSPLAGDSRLLVTSNVSGESRPAVWNPRTGARVDLAPDLPGEVTPHGWMPGAGQVLLRQVHLGRTRLWKCDASNGGRLCALAAHGDGTVSPLPIFPDGTLWYGFSSLSEPPQVRALDLTSETPVESIVIPPPPGNSEQAAVRWESVHYDSEDGVPIHGFLGIPEGGGDGPFPALLYLHGGPTAQVTDSHVAAWNDLVARGYVVFAINFRGSTGYGREFQERINGQPGLYERKDMAAARAYLMGRGLADPERIGLMGGSYGGFLTLIGLTRQPELWAVGYATVPLCDWAMMYDDANQRLRGWARTLLGGTPEERADVCREASPISEVERIRAPLRIVAHRSDTRCPIRQVETFLAKLDACGIAAYEAEISEGGHGTRSTDEIIHHHERLVAFLDRRLKGITI